MWGTSKAIGLVREADTFTLACVPPDIGQGEDRERAKVARRHLTPLQPRHQKIEIAGRDYTGSIA